LPGARAGFHDQLAVFRERGIHGAGHLHLAGAQFKRRMRRRKSAAGTEKLAHPVLSRWKDPESSRKLSIDNGILTESPTLETAPRDNG
jgi:hypothetical protein